MSNIGPRRLQLSRRRGFDLQAVSLAYNGLPAVNCARPHKWGNRFSVLPDIKPGQRVGGALGYIAVPTVEDAVACYEIFLQENPDVAAELRADLRGKNLACWCGPNELCHVTVLLRWANSDEELLPAD